MFEYFAFVWEPQDVRASATAHRFIEALLDDGMRWRIALREYGLCVAHAGDGALERAVSLPDRGGVILGTLFDGIRPDSEDVPAQRTVFGDPEASRIVSSAGRALVKEFWGNYVAILRSPPMHSIWVLRGPASLLPCLNAGVDGVDFYFSRMETCARLGVGSFSIDWRCVARTLLGPLTSTRTGLEEVRELLPGTCYELRTETRRTQCYWSPADFSQDPPITDPSLASSTLKRITTSCVQAWACTSPRILHCLSGGLDSSIVLGLLAEAPTHPHITCLNHFSSGPDEDERHFARLAARRAGCELVEYPRAADCDLRAFFPVHRFETSPGLCMREVERIDPEVAQTVEATAIVRGHGGDELFCRHHSQNAVVDFIRTRGLRAGLMPLAIHAAMLEGLTVWDILARSIAEALTRPRWNLAAQYCRDQEGQSLLAPDVLRDLVQDRQFEPPLLREAQHLPPGKLWQLSMVCARRRAYGAFDTPTDPPRVMPLLSQPIIETCLRIPTYLQMLGRRDRALARMAFASVLPQEILDRRCKGGAEQLAQRVLARNLPFVRECLLDGHLVQQKIVARSALEGALSGAPSPAGRGTVPLFDLLGMELWLHSWTNTRPALRSSTGAVSVNSGCA